MAAVVLALRAYLRYLVPLTVLSAAVLAPALIIAVRMPPPGNAAQARIALTAAWVLAATAWICQLALVGAAAPLVRSLASGQPVSQLRGLASATAHLVRAIVPCLAALAAVAIGGLALVVPGLVLLVLLSLTAASTERGLPAPLAESIEVVRANWRIVAVIVGTAIALDLALAGIAQQVLTEPIVRKLAPARAAAYREVVRVVAIGLVVITPIAACTLAAVHARHRRA